MMRGKTKWVAVMTLSAFCSTQALLGGSRIAWAQPPTNPSSEPSTPTTPAQPSDIEPVETPSTTPTPPPATHNQNAPQDAAPVTVTEAEAQEILRALTAHKPLAPIAKSKGTTIIGLGNAVIALARTSAAPAVQSGKVTQAQVDEKIAIIQQKFADISKEEGEVPPPPPPSPLLTPPTSTEPQGPPPPRQITPTVIVTGSIAAAALVTGIVFAIDATSKHSSYVATPDHRVAVAGERSAFVADSMFAASAIFGIIAAAVFFIRDEPTPKAKSASTTSAAPRPRWVAAPTALPQGAGVSAAIRF